MSRAPEQFAPSTRLEVLREALDTGAMRQIGRLLNALNPAEIADLLESLPLTQRAIVWELVDLEDEGGVLVEVNDEVRNSLISRMDSSEVVAAAASLDIDDLADLVAELPEAITRELLRSLDRSARLSLQAVLEYEEDSAGGLMNPNTLTVRSDVTADVVLRYLRMLREIPEDTDALFVVNRDGGYLGCCTSRGSSRQTPDRPSPRSWTPTCRPSAPPSPRRTSPRSSRTTISFPRP